MPTGYTDKIKEGISFREFAMRCARAFGACVDMRDGSMDKEIPEFEPSEHHSQEYTDCILEISRIAQMTEDDAYSESLKEYSEKVKNLKDRIKESIETKRKYDEMLQQVKEWKPPTEDHIELKKFMIKQIEDSIDWDCDTSYYSKGLMDLKLLSGEEWKQAKSLKLTEDLIYHNKHQKIEYDRVERNNQWIRDLKNSL